MFRHPSYYKKLRKRNKEEARAQLKVPSSNLDQAISLRSHDGERERSPGPGPKQQASSSKRQASSAKLLEERATSVKRQA
jgi:hypothetical protein